MASEKMKTRYEARATGRNFHEGDKVWLWNLREKRHKGLSPKLQTNWEGPYTVLQRLNDVVVRIQKSPHSKNRRKMVSILGIIAFFALYPTRPKLHSTGIHLGSVHIPEVKSLKILGIIFDPNITWKNHINYLRQKGFKYLNAIKALSSPKIGTRSDHLLNIINAAIHSIFDYGSQLFSFSSNRNRQKLEPVYNAALLLALGLPRNTPLDLLRSESMNGSINNRHNFLCQNL
ncbi:kinectin [Trichonephila clavipes]|nr:kinectin [Trichonephila clavipes]